MRQMVFVRQILLVGLGGFAGSILRYLVSGWVQRLAGAPGFGYGTLSVNVIGCLTIGLLGGRADNAGLFGPSARAFLFIGVLGGFTTFSTFAAEVTALRRGESQSAALLYLVGTVGACSAVAWLGLTLS